MSIGDTLLIRGTMIDRNGTSVRVRVRVRVRGSQKPNVVNMMCKEFWINKIDQSEVVIPLKQGEIAIDDPVLLRGRVADYDSNTHGTSIEVRIQGPDELHEEFWVHRVDQSKVIVHLKQNEEKVKTKETR